MRVIPDEYLYPVLVAPAEAQQPTARLNGSTSAE